MLIHASFSRQLEGDAFSLPLLQQNVAMLLHDSRATGTCLEDSLDKPRRLRVGNKRLRQGMPYIGCVAFLKHRQLHGYLF